MRDLFKCTAQKLNSRTILLTSPGAGPTIQHVFVNTKQFSYEFNIVDVNESVLEVIWGCNTIQLKQINRCLLLAGSFANEQEKSMRTTIKYSRIFIEWLVKL